MKIMKYLIAVAIAIILSACTSMKSIKNPEHTDDKDGLSYFLPKKDILIQFSVKQSKSTTEPKTSTSKNKKTLVKNEQTQNDSGSGDKITEVTINTTSAYPDFSKQYILNYSYNLIGKNTLNIGINRSGLLTSATSETESKINESFRALAKAGGMALANLSTDDQKEGKKCDEIGDYTFIYSVSDDFSKPKEACGYSITITKLLDDKKFENLIGTEKNKDNKLLNGIFYRQEIPYHVTVTKGQYSHQSIVFSPSASKTLFLPIHPTLFADNSAEFTFSDGIPTKYKQVVESELLALAQLPADIIEGYFEGVGALFKHISGAKEAQSGNIKHELDTLRYELCIAAINANNTNLITELQCISK